MKYFSNFQIEGKTKDESFVLIRDLGPWDKHPTVTNDVEAVVSRLIAEGQLKPGQRLIYFDSEGNLDEILVVDGRFAGFNRPVLKIKDGKFDGLAPRGSWKP